MSLWCCVFVAHFAGGEVKGRFFYLFAERKEESSDKIVFCGGKTGTCQI
jgi:hypothetical protein